MLQLVQHDDTRERYRSGLFSVHKDEVRDRMIMDSRPANMVDRSQTLWVRAMASAATLSQLVLSGDSVLQMSGEDLRDYFYQFRINKERTARNCLNDCLTKEEALFVFGEKVLEQPPPFLVGLSTLAMGDVNACEFAQSSHIGLCLQKQVCSPSELLCLRGPIPRGLLQARALEGLLQLNRPTHR